MAEHSDSDKNYDILSLSRTFSDINVKNVKKNAFCVEKYFSAGARSEVMIDQYTFHIEGHFKQRNLYYRLVLPELLPNYDKVLYLDSDTIAMDDVAKIYDMKILMVISWQRAMTPDTAGLYNGYRKDKKDYNRIRS